VLRALSLLDVLVQEPRGLGLSSAGRRAGLNKATAFRLLSSLQQAGLVIQAEPLGVYRPGLKLVQMADQVLEALDFRTVATPHMAALARDVGHAVLAGVLEGAEVVYVEQVLGSAALRIHRRVGERRSVHLSSIGKAILGYLPAVELDAALAACSFERRTEYTITSREALLAHLGEVRRRGWAIVRDEDFLGASSVSAPVFDRTSRVVGAIGIAVPSVLLTGETLERAVQLLLETCSTASADLGHSGRSPAGAAAVAD
jgi:DNA-binding IclR family transcriptional regulator